MDRSYDIEKTAHMAMEFLRLAGGRLDVLSLIKFMYLADRTSLARNGYPISYDEYYSLPYGPVLSQVYDNIKGNVKSEDHLWNTLITKEEDNTLVLKQEEEPLSLSMAELEVIRDVYNDHKAYIGAKFIEHVHRICPEWEDPQGSSSPISLEKILLALGLEQDDVEKVQSNLRMRASLEAL